MPLRRLPPLGTGMAYRVLISDDDQRTVNIVAFVHELRDTPEIFPVEGLGSLPLSACVTRHPSHRRSVSEIKPRNWHVPGSPRPRSSSRTTSGTGRGDPGYARLNPARTKAQLAILASSAVRNQTGRGRRVMHAELELRAPLTRGNADVLRQSLPHAIGRSNGGMHRAGRRKARNRQNVLDVKVKPGPTRTTP